MSGYGRIRPSEVKTPANEIVGASPPKPATIKFAEFMGLTKPPRPPEYVPASDTERRILNVLARLSHQPPEFERIFTETFIALQEADGFNADVRTPKVCEILDLPAKLQIVREDW